RITTADGRYASSVASRAFSPRRRPERIDRPHVETLPPLGLLDRAGELVLVRDLGVVEEGAGQRGDRDAVGGGAVVGVEGRGAVEADSTPAAAAGPGGDGDIDVG